MNGYIAMPITISHANSMFAENGTHVVDGIYRWCKLIGNVPSVTLNSPLKLEVYDMPVIESWYSRTPANTGEKVRPAHFVVVSDEFIAQYDNLLEGMLKLEKEIRAQEGMTFGEE